MLGIVAVGIVRESQKFSGHPCMGTLHGHLCDSTAFLLYESLTKMDCSEKWNLFCVWLLHLIDWMFSCILFYVIIMWHCTVGCFRGVTMNCLAVNIAWTFGMVRSSQQSIQLTMDSTLPAQCVLCNDYFL